MSVFESEKMDKIRVFIVDDAVVVRKIVSDAISQEPDMEVVGTAANGKIALQRIPEIKPDLVTLDVEMPEMGGIETLRELRKIMPKIPVIMFSTLTERGAQVTMEALSLGATDYVTKPANVGSVNQSKERVKTELIEKIRVLGRRSGTPSVSTRPAQAAPASHAPVTTLGASQAARPLAVNPTPRMSASKVSLVTIGVSTGGPNALSEVMQSFPKNFPVPILIVQHMPPIFTKLLAERLDSQSELKIIEAEEGMRIEAGCAYLAPGDYHMELHQAGDGLHVHLVQTPPENSCRPAVDVLFRSVASHFGPQSLAVVLTGMGQDGLKGCEEIKRKGGEVFAQDEATSVVWGMPGAVVTHGLADRVLPLKQVTNEIVTRVCGRV